MYIKLYFKKVYSREESDVGSSSDSYILRTLEKENHILSILKHGKSDICVQLVFLYCNKSTVSYFYYYYLKIFILSIQQLFVKNF